MSTHDESTKPSTPALISTHNEPTNPFTPALTSTHDEPTNPSTPPLIPTHDKPTNPPPTTTTSLPKLLPRPTHFTPYQCRLACALALHIRFQDDTPIDRATINSIMYSIYNKDLSAAYPNFDGAMERYMRDDTEIGEGTEWPHLAEETYRRWLDPLEEFMEQAIELGVCVKLPES